MGVQDTRHTDPEELFVRQERIGASPLFNLPTATRLDAHPLSMHRQGILW